MSQPTWSDRLADALPDDLGREVDVFESQMDRVRDGKLDDRLFIEARLRRGAYGQRYDNGQRHDGVESRVLAFPSGEQTKGPHTMWDAPGMQRIKIPYGKLTAEQLDTLAALSEEYSDAILHITTRQDIQLHFVHIADTPDMMRRLGAVGITTREACGNSVRNVTACPYAGVCSTEGFDVSIYAHAFTQYFLGHPDVQDFGRKFKVAFSGCEEEACGLVTFHDLGAIAQTRIVDGVKKRGFKVYVGGGLGAVPFMAKVLDDFVPEEELLALSQAVCRVFARLGEKRSRARARIKFLVQKLGFDEFKRLVEEERKTLRPDPEWTAFLENLNAVDETPIRSPGPVPSETNERFKEWSQYNLRPQAQDGFFTATVCWPLGDVSADQARGLAELAREYTGDAMRTTVEQNLVFRWLAGSDAPAFFERLEALGLAETGAGTITDITSCPGTDTCKLGISASRGLSGEMRRRLNVIKDDLDPAVKNLRIKASGCFNSCSQHHVADLGFYGVSRQVSGRRVPHFQVVLGGQWQNNGGTYGLAIGAVPSKNAPAAIERLTTMYKTDRQGDESFQDFIKRTGKGAIKKALMDLLKPPSYDEDPSYYSDWGDPREFTIGDMGIGECAGEIVPFVEFGLAASEREVFEAQLKLDDAEKLEGDARGQGVSAAAEHAFQSMVTAAQALVRHLGHQVGDAPGEVVDGFRTHLYDTEIFFDPFAKGKFGAYLFKNRAPERSQTTDPETAHHLIEEAQLFIEAAHACYGRITEQQSNEAAE